MLKKDIEYHIKLFVADEKRMERTLGSIGSSKFSLLIKKLKEEGEIDTSILIKSFSFGNTYFGPGYWHEVMDNPKKNFEFNRTYLMYLYYRYQLVLMGGESVLKRNLTLLT